MMKVYVVLSLVAAASAHMCLLSPPQRGSISGINKAGADDCILLNAPCGRPEASPDIAISAAQNFTVIFQKNLNHWTAATPGYFTVGVATSNFESYQELLRVPDRGEPSLTLYSANITLPVSMKGNVAVIQAQYVTRNPQAPAVFYQCSDVMIN